MLAKLFPVSQRSIGPFDAGAEEFLSLDLERIAGRLDLARKGEARAKLGLPRPDATSPDDIELAVASEIGDLARMAHDALLDYLHALRNRAAPILASDRPDQIRGIAYTAVTKMLADVRNGVGALFNRRRDMVLAHRDLDAFMQQNRLSRPATYPDSRFWHFSILVLLWASESAANAFLLGEASEFGVLGGFVDMVFISFVNLTMGFFIGTLVLPQLRHVSVMRKLVFAPTLILGFAALLVFDLFVGHYRDVIAVSAGDLDVVDFGARALEKLRRSPLGLSDFKSWIFVLVGLIFAAFAMIDGWRWDDPYPGYGAKDRHQKRLIIEYGRLFESLQNRLRDMAAEEMGSVDENAERAGRHQQELVAIRERMKGLREKLRVYYSQLELAGRRLVETYRQANLAVRGDGAQPPAYFNDPFKLSDDDRRIPDIEIGTTSPGRDLSPAASRARNGIEATHRQLLDVYKTIHELTAEEVELKDVTEFIGTVTELEAQITARLLSQAEPAQLAPDGSPDDPSREAGSD